MGQFLLELNKVLSIVSAHASAVICSELLTELRRPVIIRVSKTIRKELIKSWEYIYNSCPILGDYKKAVIEIRKYLNTQDWLLLTTFHIFRLAICDDFIAPI